MRRRRRLQPSTPPLSPLPPALAPLSGVWLVAVSVLVIAYIGLGVGHLTTTPVAPSSAVNYINAPDEAAHFGYIRAIAEGGTLPVRGDPDYPTYEWHQPPLYYAVASLFYTAGPAAIRGLSLLFGLGTLLVIFLAARTLCPSDPFVSVLSVGFAALLPMRQAICSSAGNDALTELLFAATILALVSAFRNGLTTRRSIVLGLLVGLAVLTKATGMLLIPIVGVALIFMWREGETFDRTWRASATILLTVGVLTSGHFARNMRLYGEITPVQAFVHEFEGTQKAADWIGTPRTVDLVTGELAPGEPMTRTGYLSLVANWTFRTFWAAYTPPVLARVGLPAFLPPAYYVPCVLLTALALAGLGRAYVSRKATLTGMQIKVLYLLFIAVLVVGGSFAGFIWTFFQAQGRYLYPAMLPIALLFGAGARAAVAGRYRDVASGAVLAVLFLLAVGFLFAAVGPAYGR